MHPSGYVYVHTHVYVCMCICTCICMLFGLSLLIYMHPVGAVDSWLLSPAFPCSYNPPEVQKSKHRIYQNTLVPIWGQAGLLGVGWRSYELEVAVGAQEQLLTSRVRDCVQSRLPCNAGPFWASPAENTSRTRVLVPLWTLCNHKTEKPHVGGFLGPTSTIVQLDVWHSKALTSWLLLGKF